MKFLSLLSKWWKSSLGWLRIVYLALLTVLDSIIIFIDDTLSLHLHYILIYSLIILLQNLSKDMQYFGFQLIMECDDSPGYQNESTSDPEMLKPTNYQLENTIDTTYTDINSLADYSVAS